VYGRSSTWYTHFVAPLETMMAEPLAPIIAIPPRRLFRYLTRGDFH
jgi:hypothetical protein